MDISSNRLLNFILFSPNWLKTLEKTLMLGKTESRKRRG